MWDEVTYPFTDFNGGTVKVWKWVSIFVLHFTGRVIIYPCWQMGPSLPLKTKSCQGAKFVVTGDTACCCPNNPQ